MGYDMPGTSCVFLSLPPRFASNLTSSIHVSKWWLNAVHSGSVKKWHFFTDSAEKMCPCFNLQVSLEYFCHWPPNMGPAEKHRLWDSSYFPNAESWLGDRTSSHSLLTSSIQWVNECMLNLCFTAGLCWHSSDCPALKEQRKLISAVNAQGVEGDPGAPRRRTAGLTSISYFPEISPSPPLLPHHPCHFTLIFPQ